MSLSLVKNPKVKTAAAIHAATDTPWVSAFRAASDIATVCGLPASAAIVPRNYW
ncbi:hypothetical protein [Arthrobacter alpinus]|uniref:hypothetical protein n=1 Tax=Arthrobacter alpinus TaxID=656366 RepID=UPI00136493C0|nr:hypothetical protein [Arthrobacter alpinus]